MTVAAKKTKRAIYDIVIVGAGPAGIALAKQLQNRRYRGKVLILEKERFPRDKICGDALTQNALALVRDIFPETRERIPSKSFTSRSCIVYEGARRIGSDQLQLDVIPRREFDHALFQTLEPSSCHILEEAAVTELLWEEGRACGVKARTPQGEKVFHGGLIVGADGSNSFIRRQTGPTNKDNRIHAIRAYARGIPAPADGLLSFIDTEKSGYFWQFPYREGDEWCANIGYVSSNGKSTNIRKRFHEWLENSAVRPLLKSASINRRSIKGFPLNLARARIHRVSLSRPLSGKGFLLLGDAGGLVHPYVGEGISFALASGKLVADLVAAGTEMPELGTLAQAGVVKLLQRQLRADDTFTLFHLPCQLHGAMKDKYLELLARKFG